MHATFKIWLLAVRPKTLPASIAPVLMGTAMAFGDGIHHWPSALVALFAALTIQIGTNLANDYFDFQKGADHEGRLGPTRVTQAGLVDPRSVKSAFVLMFLLSALACFYLIQRGGWPIAVIAILSILCGVLYTAGPFPLAYLGLGEIFVLIFFGPVAVAGTYYVQSFEVNPAVIVAGLAPGLFSTAILGVNNLRDIETDRKAGKKTLAVRFGRAFAINEYLFCIFAGSLIPVLTFTITKDYFYTLTAVAVLFLSIPAIKTVAAGSEGPALNRTLAATGKLLLLYSVIFSIGWIL
jgi:1,4-dihydroxy-2-naphthoate octaprenyltransferase